MDEPPIGEHWMNLHPNHDNFNKRGVSNPSSITKGALRDHRESRYEKRKRGNHTESSLFLPRLPIGMLWEQTQL